MDPYSKSVRNSASPLDCILFDLDDTLYPINTGIGQSLKKNIDDFLVEKCGIPETKASSLRIELFRTYGSSLAGLRALGYDISAEDYHSFVHGRLPYESIKPDMQLRNLLCSIKQRKIIFTNSDRIHAVKALDRLGLSDCFELIICFETMNPNLPNSTRPDEYPILLKPSLDAFNIALHVANIDPCRTLFLDDSIRNVAAGKAMGLHTVLVGKSVKCEGADYVAESVNKLTQVVPEIWVGANNEASEHKRIRRSKSELDSLLAPTPIGA